jgi:hypothetical protein
MLVPEPDPAMSEFKEGIYDQLITRRLREFLGRQSVLKSSVDALEEADCPDYLARHLIRQIKSSLRGMPAEPSSVHKNMTRSAVPENGPCGRKI